MASRDADLTPRYRFGPLERRGIVAGWRGGQIATLCTGLLVGVVVLRVDSSLAGGLVALLAVGVSIVAATWPVAGRSLEEWAPDALRYSVDNTRRRGRRTDPFSTLELLSVDISESGDATREVGVVVDRSVRTYATAFRASGAGFVLSGDHEKAERVNSWSHVLASLSREGSTVHRLQWLARTVPHRSTDLPSELGNEVLLVLAVHPGKGSRRVSAPNRGDLGASSALLREVTALSRRMTEIGIDTRGVLAPGDLASAMRASFEAGSRESRCSTAWPWPMATKPEWRHVMTDGTFHTTYWISEWPRTDVGPDFLCPLLLLREFRVAVSVVMQPLRVAEAARKIEQSRTADIADSELRRRGGFLATVRRRREEETLLMREGELADGHSPFRFSGYVTVSAYDMEELETACAETEQAAARCGLELRLCYGDQGRAFTTTMPLARGLP